MKHAILRGPDEWRQVSAALKPVLKIGDIKFYECPVSAITPRSWERMKLVNETTGGENTDILHLPFPGTILDQPPWYREAVRIVRHERAEHRSREFEKQKNGS